MGKSDPKMTKSLEEKGLKLISPNEKVDASISLSIDGSEGKEDDLIQLLEDTINYIKAAKDTSSAQAWQKVETTFQRLKTNDVVSLKHRS